MGTAADSADSDGQSDQHGPEPSDALRARRDLAVARGRAGELAGSIADLEALLIDADRILGGDHPDSATVRRDLVVAFEEVVNDRLVTLGQDHPDTLAARFDLATWQGRAGDLRGAVIALKKLLDDQTRVLGRSHQQARRTRLGIAYWQGEAAGFRSAQLLHSVLALPMRIFRRSKGKNMPAN
jgi:hypothetical protein